MAFVNHTTRVRDDCPTQKEVNQHTGAADQLRGNRAAAYNAILRTIVGISIMQV